MAWRRRARGRGGRGGQAAAGREVKKEEKQEKQEPEVVETPKPAPPPKFSLVGTLKHYIGSPLFSDVSLVVTKAESKDEIKIPAHKFVLSIHSQALAKLLFPEKGDSPTELKVEGDLLAVWCMLEAMYNTEPKINELNFPGCQALAKKYGIVVLQEACNKYQASRLSPDTACSMLLAAAGGDSSKATSDEKSILPESVSLKKDIIKYICLHVSQVFKSEGFKELTPALLAEIVQQDTLGINEVELFRLVVKWGKDKIGKAATNAQLKALLEPVIPHIRFPLMQTGEIATIVAPTELITGAQVISLFTFLGGVSSTDTGFSSKKRTSIWGFDEKSSTASIEIKADGSGIRLKSPPYGHFNGSEEFTGGKHAWKVRVHEFQGTDFYVGISTQDLSSSTRNSSGGVNFWGWASNNNSFSAGKMTHIKTPLSKTKEFELHADFDKHRLTLMVNTKSFVLDNWPAEPTHPSKKQAKKESSKKHAWCAHFGVRGKVFDITVTKIPFAMKDE